MPAVAHDLRHLAHDATRDATLCDEGDAALALIAASEIDAALLDLDLGGNREASIAGQEGRRFLAGPGTPDIPR